MLDGCFQLGPGLGPRREQLLWADGLTTWSAFEDAPSSGRSTWRDRLKRHITFVREAHEKRDVAAVADALPTREHWRLVPWLESRAAFLDIETTYAGDLTAVGIWGPRGPEIFLPHGCSAGRPLEAFASALEGVDLLVTYNGASFDVPVLRKHFPDWQQPPVHVDLCHLWRRLGHRGGLKMLEQVEGIRRPAPLQGLDGADAVYLWQAALRGDARAMRRFVAYNLADVAHLHPLLVKGYNRMCAELGRDWPSLANVARDDLLADLSPALRGLRPPRFAPRTYAASNPTRLY